MSIDKMAKEFKDFSELKAFADAQTLTIIDLSKKLTQKDQEISHLKSLLEKSVPLLNTDRAKELQRVEFLTNDEEAICREQLFRLKELSSDRELSLEETKRVEIFSKILIALKDKPKTIKVEAKHLSDAELIAIAQGQNAEDDSTKSN